MTNIQKNKIENMRKTGTSYGDIASMLNISVNTVKSYCRRNNLNAVVETENCTGKVCCKVCGTDLEKQDGLITEFDTELWCSLVDFATVKTDGEIEFTFKNGTTI
jgi:IS30 family transposase